MSKKDEETLVKALEQLRIRYIVWDIYNSSLEQVRKILDITPPILAN